MTATSSSTQPSSRALSPDLSPPGSHRIHQPIAEETDSAAVQADVDSLPGEAMTVSESGYRVFHTKSAKIPHLMREVARQREIAFRAVGEGSGNPLDCDRFDKLYDHLILWDDTHHRIAGAYRMGKTDEILAEHGADGLYCSSLFQFEPDFLAELNPSLEMGRSFVRPEYQKAIKPLSLLWKAVLNVTGRDHRYQYAYGPVSISQDYTPISQWLIVEYLNRQVRDERRSLRVKPRNPFRARGIEGLNFDQISESLKSIEDVSARISQTEPDGKGLPVLLRQYLKWNAKILSFNVDPDFENVLDALILIDFRQAPMKMLHRYMGKLAAESFVQWHDPDSLENS